MTETRRKLNPEHRSFNGTGIAGFLIFGFGAFLWLVMMAWDPSTSSQADYAGLAFLTGLSTLICLVIGGLLSFGTLVGGNRVDCHCAKCCGNVSENGLYCNGHGRASDVSYYNTADVQKKMEELRKEVAERRQELEREKRQIGGKKND